MDYRPRLGRTDFVVLQETPALNLRANDHALVSFVNFPGTLLTLRRRFPSSKTWFAVTRVARLIRPGDLSKRDLIADGSSK
jgi:hypothetical protein